MPTYEYRCPNGHDFERFFRSISSAEAETTVACPVCGAVAVRQLSSAGLQFKGSGFYLTDYGKNAHGKKAPPAPSGSGEGGGSSSGSGDASSSASGGGAASGAAESGGSGESAPAKPSAKKSDKPATSSGPSTKPSSGNTKE
jgi:putative FmdB family regulatory protein